MNNIPFSPWEGPCIIRMVDGKVVDYHPLRIISKHFIIGEEYIREYVWATIDDWGTITGNSEMLAPSYVRYSMNSRPYHRLFTTKCVSHMISNIKSAIDS